MNRRRKNDFNFIEYIEHNKKNIIINLIIFTSLLFVLLLIDLLTKQFLFKWETNGKGINQNGGCQTQNWLFGIRSVANSGLTTFGNVLPLWLVHFFNFIILFVSLFFLITLRSWLFAIGISFIFAGTLGNMIDRFAFQGNVRDIIYFPWLDRGTFNFADVDAVIGSIMSAITLVVQCIKNYSYKD